jgi:hypothetical protein
MENSPALWASAFSLRFVGSLFIFSTLIPSHTRSRGQRLLLAQSGNDRLWYRDIQDTSHCVLDPPWVSKGRRFVQAFVLGRAPIDAQMRGPILMA